MPTAPSRPAPPVAYSAATTLADLPDVAARSFGAREALVDDEVRWTFTTLRDRIRAAARAAIAHGIEPGDRFALWAPNSRTWVVAALGAVSVGAVLVPLNTRYRAAEAADIVRRSGCTVLFTERGFLGTDYVAMLRESGEDLGALRSTVVLRGADPGSADGATSWEAYLAAGEAVPEEVRAARAAAVRPGDLSDIQYTSGTTGRPKGVLTTHHQTVRVFDAWAEAVTLREGDRYLLISPFFHTFGYKAGVVACLLRGATVVPEEVYDGDRALRRVAEERVSVLAGAPAIFHGLITHPRRAAYDLSSLRLAGTGAANIPAGLIDDVRTVLGARDVFAAYGLTESTGVVTICPVDSPAETLARSVGRPIEGVELRVVAPDGTPLPSGCQGEVVTRGYHVTQGYLDDPRATAEAIDADGWLHTGDVGVLDEDGFLALTDRLKDMYVVGGFNAYPAEVENTLRTHPAVSDAAVVGAADARLGEVGVAFVVADGDLPDAAELTAWTRERLANFKVPRRFVAVDALPRNAAGKVLKNELRALAERREPPTEKV
ncbi:FadD3 family acyl-CoA ligase [Streptomyces sp. NPDC088745]|uniref:FadD3 family acyl-CoA ligase n=1 Tax=Streptomyces sp. NPDC088745 TaxID=3365884 RepID=UPI00381BDE47